MDLVLEVRVTIPEEKKEDLKFQENVRDKVEDAIMDVGLSCSVFDIGVDVRIGIVH